MQKLISLLGLWLLLSQLPRESQAQNWNTVVKACGRELARMQIRICGNSLATWKDVNDRRVRRESGPPTETEPTSKKTDEENLKLLSESITKLLNTTLSLNHPVMIKLQQLALEDGNTSFEKFQEIISSIETEETRTVSNLISEDGDKQPRRKRQVVESLSSKCCHSGCTLREIARFC